MVDKSQKVIAKWNSNNRKHFESIGYKFTHQNDELEVSIDELPRGSHVKICVICDYCGKEMYKPYRDYLSQKNSGEGEDCCYECAKFKRGKTNQKRYGGNSPSCDKNVVEKQRNTFLEKYGVTSPAKNKEVQSKIKNTCLERYGTDIAAKADMIKNKAMKTCEERYGGKSSQCSPDVRRKTMNTRMNNGNIPVSKQELAMIELLKEIYGEENCISQYILDRIAFDCLIIVNGVKIDVEYDGKYWHKDEHKDIRRDYFTISKGYKVLRFRGNYAIPTREQIINSVNYLVNSEHHHLIIDI